MLSIIAPIIGGLISSSSSKKAARKAEQVGKENARDLLAASTKNAAEIIRIAGLNADAILDTANLNAESIHKIGLANALSHIQAGQENIGISEFETLEVLRRQQLRAVETVHATKAATGASGVRLGVGSPLEVLQGNVEAAHLESQYLGAIGMQRIKKIGTEAARKGALTWMDASERGKVILRTAAIQASITKEEAASRSAGLLRDAELNAASLRRGGTLLAMNYRNQATASMVGGIMSGLAAWKG